ncbi:MAG: metal-dependent phosphohydrolase [Actinomycetota bacterium]|nr:metal-dependent phosphohydrolase [Actinomycetota bacterium]
MLTRWLSLVPDAAPALAERAGRDLLARYAEPQRRYHDRRHLTEVLGAVDELAEAAARPDVVRLAAWFHDAVYDPQAAPGANEEASALLALRMLPDLAVAADPVAAVAALVRLTARHEVVDGDGSSAGFRRDAEVLFDADLWILASPTQRYAAYAADVRAEYAHVPDDLFRTGRAAILRGFADRARIYCTPTAFARWEEPARANLAKELADLS